MLEFGLPSQAQAIADNKAESTRDRVKKILGIVADGRWHGYTTTALAKIIDGMYRKEKGD